MTKIILICFTAALGISAVIAQCLNRQPNYIYNRPMPETIIETVNYGPQPYFQPKVIEAQNVPMLQQNSVYPTPTTIITDCTPSVCKNLIDIIQLMAVCNVMRDKRGGLDLPLQVSAPIVNEILSSPSFLCGCPNPLLPNVSPSLYSPMYPNVLGPPNVLAPIPNGNPGAVIGNILSMLGN